MPARATLTGLGQALNLKVIWLYSQPNKAPIGLNMVIGLSVSASIGHKPDIYGSLSAAIDAIGLNILFFIQFGLCAVKHTYPYFALFAPMLSDKIAFHCVPGK